MRTKLHLVSMPWSSPDLPSIQTAVLKAYVDSVLGRQVQTRTFSAFASILLEQTHGGFINYYEKYEEFEEYPYFVMYCQELLRRTPRLRRVSIEKLIARINESDAAEQLTLGKI